jgi:PAS domain S-box-containing protein
VEQALAESKQRLASIVDSAFDAIISFDAAGRIILFNAAAAAMFGCAASEALGRSIDRFIPAPFRETRAGRPVTGRGGSGESFRAVARETPNKGIRENGEEFPIEASISRVQVGGSTLVTVILRDVTDRQRLEREVLEIGGREQLRIGQELHDDVCQWLAATEFLANSLARDLARRSPADVASARKLGSAIRQALTRARNLAHGLAPAVIESMGLGGALRELARDAGEMSNTRCGYRGSDILPALDPGVALHLYRIAQEAVSNAIRHGRAKKIAISLLARKASIVLRIRDNGCGIPVPLLHHSGIGLRTMRYRADVIGATIVLRPGRAGGTEVECVLPIPPAKQIGSG